MEGVYMKIILSRKGFDSANGGIVSPIFNNGTMLSFPIPSKDHKKDKIKYSDLVCNGVSLRKILYDLGYKGDPCCHLDPDLVWERRKNRVKDWKPAFGQINQSATYLINKGIKEGDLFLFFGNFRHVLNVNGQYKYVPNNLNNNTYHGHEIQAIWGYLQVGEMIKDPDEQKKFSWHPHSCDERVYFGNDNIIFTAAKELSFAPGMPGCGILPYDIKRVLTMPGKSKAIWKEEKAYNVDNIYANRKNSVKNGKGIYYAGIWQELVLKENQLSDDWAKSMLAR